MSSETDFKKSITDQMKSQVKAAGLDPSKINSNDIQVDVSGSSVKVEYGGAVVSLPAPSQPAIDQWFAENGKVIAQSLLTLAAVVVGAVIVSKSQ